MSKTIAFRSVPGFLLAPSLLAFLVVLGPMLGLFARMPWADVPALFAEPAMLQAARLSIVTATVSTLICGLLGAPTALILTKVLARSRFASFTFPLYCLIYAPVIFSPVVSGLALIFFWGRRGVLGSWLTEMGISVAFSPLAVILAQVFVALPFFVATAVTTLRALPVSYEEIALVEGASPAEVTRKVLLPLAAPGLITAFLLSFARALGEYGATVTFAGNVAGATRTIPLNIELALSSNHMDAALGSALMLISLYILILGTLALATWLRRLKGANL